MKRRHVGRPRLQPGGVTTPTSSPDADGDGFGDETQDLCAADPTRQTACVAELAVRGTATPAAAADRSMAMRVRVTSRATDAQAGNNAAAFANAVRVRRGTCVNRLVGTASADVLRGAARGDRLSGAGGRDRIVGRAGADCLTGGRGRDTISGGPGNDVMNARDGAVDTVSCGPGRDTVRADRRDRLRGCERRRR
jgi:Ca2+-binding RTX toxin-like protein